MIQLLLLIEFMHVHTKLQEIVRRLFNENEDDEPFILLINARMF
jgi:hypothetical protein